MSLNFLNDAWGGTPALDRNLYLDGASYAGSAASPASLTFDWGGAQTVTVSSGLSSTAAVPSSSPPAFSATDTAATTSDAATGEAYSGSVASLQQQFIWSSADGVAVASNVPDVFLHGGTGDDALSAMGGTNAFDGGAGSNFLVGADGSDGGVDTFFVDGRGTATTWSTVVNFHHGDSLTIWGFVPGVSTMPWTASDGADGYKGATIHSELAGAGTGVSQSATLAGLSIADVASKLSITIGNVDGQDYLRLTYTG